MEAEQLVAASSAEREGFKEKLYRHACQQLLNDFQEIVDRFNVALQAGRIEALSSRYACTYRLPANREINVRFFSHRDTDVTLRGGRLIGGGYAELVGGPSANLLLLSEGDDDLYGRWIGCLMDIHALVSPSNLIGTRGLTRETVRPFGFSGADDFYKKRFNMSRVGCTCSPMSSATM